MLGVANKPDDGIIFNIQKMSVHDGPGIRTTVFLKGCPLRCRWCSNPESQHQNIEIACFKKRCIQCGDCAAVCPEKIIENGNGFSIMDKSKCTMCMKCVESCCTNSKNVIGKSYSKEKLLTEILKDKPFYDSSGGGVTFSGGEPLMQAGFLLEILKLCKINGVHTAIETTGMGNIEDFLTILEYVDLIYYDLKHMDGEVHEELTGISNKKILNNLAAISQRHTNINVRIAVIPGLNDSLENIWNTADYVGSFAIPVIELLPYHSLGENKYEQLGREYSLSEIEAPSVDYMEQLAEEARKAIGTRDTRVHVMKSM